MKSLNGYGFDASALGGKAPSAYASAADLAKKAEAAHHVLAFPASGWVQGTDGAYTQQVAAGGVTAEQHGHVDVDMSAATAETAAQLLEAWALIGRAQTVSGGLLLTCYGMRRRPICPSCWR